MTGIELDRLIAERDRQVAEMGQVMFESGRSADDIRKAQAAVAERFRRAIEEAS